MAMEISDAASFLSARHQAVIVTLSEGEVPHATNVVYACDFWSCVATTCEVELSPVSTEPGDATGQERLAVGEAVQGKPHPDPAEFMQAMVDDQRLVLRLTPTAVHGQLSR